MGNMHRRFNMALVIILVLAMSAHECWTSQGKLAPLKTDLYPLDTSSDAQHKDNTVFFGAHRNSTESSGISEVHSAWPAVFGALTAVFSVVLLTALTVKYRFFRWCQSRNSHAPLLDGDTASQFSQATVLEGEIPVRGMRGRMIHRGESSDDDDGYIEDNYIQASVTEKVLEEENQLEYVDDSDDELIIPEIVN